MMRDRLLATAAKYQLSTYLARYVAPDFQRAIRAEAGAVPPGPTPAMVNGTLAEVFRTTGECVCVTCGKRDQWSGNIGGMHTGHFLASRANAIVLEEDNVAPQCAGCNRFRGGEPQLFRAWMLAVRGHDAVARLERLKGTSRSFTRDELVDLRIAYLQRLKDAMRRITTPHQNTTRKAAAEVSVAVAAIIATAETQSRLKHNAEVVAEYAELLGDGEWPFPPLDVFGAGPYYLADGFHRLAAARSADRETVPCHVHDGGAVEAKLFAIRANDRHGLRMTRADKRACVEWLIAQFPGASQRSTADRAGVSVALVREILAARAATLPLGDARARSRAPIPQQTGKKADFTPPAGGKTNDTGKPAPDVPEPESGTEPEADPFASDDPFAGPARGRCPNCAGTQWDEGDTGVSCARCHHPHGEPAGDVDSSAVARLRALARKHVEATMRALDDLHCVAPRRACHAEAIGALRAILTAVKEWQ